DEIAALSPDDAGALHRAGEAFRRQGHKAEAVDRFTREVALYARQGFLIKGVAVCKLILEIDPGHTQAQAQLAHLSQLARAPSPSPSVTAPAGPPPTPPTPPVQLLTPGEPLDSTTLSQLLRAARPVAPHVVEIPLDFDEAPAPLPPKLALPPTPLFS